MEFVSEADLERLNLARTSDEVIQRKLDEVQIRLEAATEITLDGAGRITTDGVAIDASPEHAAMYQALMDTGTIPGLGVTPAQIDQGSGGFDEWMLAAAAVGTAGGKSVPIGPDTIEYYGRIAAPTGGVADWGYIPVLPPPDTFAGEEFIDYTGFSHTRADVYEGCTTWLDVPTLTWKYGRVLDRVEFLDVVDLAAQTVPGTVDNVAGFTQMADDVRSVINYLHENEVVVNPDTGFGFYIDPVFQDTCTDPNPALAPEGTPLSQAEMVAYLNALVIEAEPPTVTITDAPAATTTATDATFIFDAGADATRVLCVLDSGAIEDCLSPKTYTGLAPGEHTFTVIAMGAGGVFASDTHTWTIVLPGEETMITPLDSGSLRRHPTRLGRSRPAVLRQRSGARGRCRPGADRRSRRGAGRSEGGGCQCDVGGRCCSWVCHGVPVWDGAECVDCELSGGGERGGCQ